MDLMDDFAAGAPPQEPAQDHEHDELYIVLDNYGLPHYADPECTRLHYFTDAKQAQAYAIDLANANPNSVITVFRKITSLFHDGRFIRTIDG